MAYVVVAAMFAVVSLTALFAGGEACNNVESMTWTAACRRTNRWQKVCQQVLQGSTASETAAKVTLYARIATKLANLRYEDTLSVVDTLLRPGNSPADARAALDNCKVKYGSAQRLMDAVADQIFVCNFAYARQEYIDAEVGVRSCQDGLLRLPNEYHSWPLFAKVSDDHEVTVVAYLLGAIFLGR